MLIELPLTDYVEAWNLQRALVAAKARGELHDDLVLSLQHSPVFTIGRRGGREHLKVTEDFLKRSGIPVIEVERGGNITFHGPGQLVVYPIIDLEAAGIRVDEYVCRLEEAMIRTAAAWGISAGRNPLNKGVWVGGNKLGSIGLTIRHGVSFHGLAFNVNVRLDPFSWINPCGLDGVGVTSLERELSREVSLTAARERLMSHIEEVFDVNLVQRNLCHDFQEHICMTRYSEMYSSDSYNSCNS
ncbi:lipoyl(octanoyl) transferase LipB [Candidatus Poribacteria bacterium]|nr:lipoyl(octanoyl) transferase LipB [Candidatus Poribacteria bacterium]